MKTSDETKAVETGSTPGRDEARHTPGPWEAYNGEVTTKRQGSRSFRRIAIVQDYGLGCQPEVDEANAQLIASAPKLAADNAALLAALRAVVAALEQPVQYSGLRMAESSDILRADAAAAANIARAAIERAEGGAE